MRNKLTPPDPVGKRFGTFGFFRVGFSGPKAHPMPVLGSVLTSINISHDTRRQWLSPRRNVFIPEGWQHVAGGKRGTSDTPGLARNENTHTGGVPAAWPGLLASLAGCEFRGRLSPVVSPAFAGSTTGYKLQSLRDLCLSGQRPGSHGPKEFQVFSPTFQSRVQDL